MDSLDFDYRISAELSGLRGLGGGDKNVKLIVDEIWRTAGRPFGYYSQTASALAKLGRRVRTVLSAVRELEGQRGLTPAARQTVPEVARRAHRLAAFLILKVHQKHGDELWSPRLCSELDSECFAYLLSAARRRLSEERGEQQLFNGLDRLWHGLKIQMRERQAESESLALAKIKQEEGVFCAERRLRFSTKIVEEVADIGTRLALCERLITAPQDMWELIEAREIAEELYEKAWLFMGELGDCERQLCHYESSVSREVKGLVGRRRNTLQRQLDKMHTCFVRISQHPFLLVDVPVGRRNEQDNDQKLSVTPAPISCTQELEFASVRPGSLWRMQIRPGDCYVTRTDNAYNVVYYGPKKQQQKLRVQVLDGRLCCGGDNYNSLYSLLKARVPGYCLIHAPADSDIRALAYRQLRPQLIETGDAWAAVLDPEDDRRSFWMSRSGDVYVAGDDLLGSGGYKEVTRMRKIFGEHIAEPQAVGLFHADAGSDPAKYGRLLGLLRKDFGNDPRFLIPEQLPLRVVNQTGEISKRQVQRMPEMAGDLAAMWKELSKQGQLRALKQAAEILHCMADKHWYYADAKPDNFLLRKPLDADRPKVCLGDFDLAGRLSGNTRVHAGTRGYCDPRVVRDDCVGWRAARVADQFSFAMMALCLLTGHHADRSVSDQIFGAAVSSSQLRYVSGWYDLNAGIRCMLTNCLVGLKGRQYQMADVIQVFERALLMEECIELEGYATSPRRWY